LLRATEYLIFPQFRRLKKEKAEAKSAEPDWKDKSASDVFGTLWMKLLTQLHRAHKKRVPAEKLEHYICVQLKWAEATLNEELRGPDDMRAARVRGKIKEAKPTANVPRPPKKIPDDPTVNHRRHLLHDPDDVNPVDEAIDSEQRKPGKQMERLEKIKPHANSPLERRIVGMMLAGFNLKEVCASLGDGTTVDQATTIIAGISQRAENHANRGR
jgi:hypothetical protein